MRILFFILFFTMLVLLITLVDWQQKLAELAGDNKLEGITQLLPDDSIPVPVDTVASDTADQFQPELSQNGSAKDLLMPDLPLHAGDGLVLPPPLVMRRVKPAPSRQHQAKASKPTPSRPFRDVSEEPYLDESRRLLQQIRDNYDAILQGNSNRAQKQNQP